MPSLFVIHKWLMCILINCLVCWLCQPRHKWAGVFFIIGGIFKNPRFLHDVNTCPHVHKYELNICSASQSHEAVCVKLATIVEGDPKAPFSIATTPCVGEGATPFPGLLHFTLEPYLIMLSVKQGGIKYHF